MKLSEYLDGLRAASSAEALEVAIQQTFKHRYSGPTWSRISKTRIAAGLAICNTHPLGRFVPRMLGTTRRLTTCDETYRVGRGMNSTGVRYVWHGAKVWSTGVLQRNRIGRRAAERIWSTCFDYPHRALQLADDALAGRLPDPELDVLCWHEPTEWGSPIRYSNAQNDADDGDRRATRACRCGGTLFDWGAGSSDGFDFINWHCNACPDIATEYLSDGRLHEIRNPVRVVA